MLGEVLIPGDVAAWRGSAHTCTGSASLGQKCLPIELVPTIGSAQETELELRPPAEPASSESHNSHKG